MRGHVLDCEAGDKIIFIREISHCPQQVRRDGFRACFDAELHPPPCAILVADIEFWVGASFVFLEESHSAVRLITFATLAIEEIARCNIDWIAPEDRRSLWSLLGLWPVFGDGRGYRQQNEQRNICSSPAHSEPSLQDLDAHFFVRVPEIGGQNTVQSRRSA